MRKWLFLGLGLYVAWALFVMLSGMGYNALGVEWNFERVGQLGDAFGVLNAGMASLAAIFTLQTLLHERDETKRLREREEARDVQELAKEDERRTQQAERNALEAAREAEIRRQESLRDLAQLRRDTEERKRGDELTFFRMLDLRREILGDVTWNGGKGIDAFRNLALRLRDQDGDRTRQNYNWIKINAANSLDHYFRTTYHIVRFVDDRFDYKTAYGYSRLLRAQLSAAEQFMIGINSTLGAGRDKMLPLINQYALLHNIEPKDRAFLIGLGAGLTDGAFDSPSFPTLPLGD